MTKIGLAYINGAVPGFEDFGNLPTDIVKENGLAQISDSSALQSIVDNVIAENEKAINDYKGGRTNVLGFLVGQCMKQSKGQGNPAMFKEMMIAAIENS